MRLGIIGLPQSGKTTIFNALTRGDQPTTVSGGRFEVRTAVVDVPDERVERLSAMFHPQKTTFAKVTYADIAGLEGSQATDGGSRQERPLRPAAQPAQPDGRLRPRGALLRKPAACRTRQAASTRCATWQPWMASCCSTT